MAEARFDADIVSELLDADAPGPAAAWLHHGQGSIADIDAETALSAIEAARRLGLGLRLHAAKDEARDKVVRKAAGAAIQRLKSAGAKIEAPLSQRSWTLSAELHAPQPPIAMLGMPGPNGYFPYMFVAFNGSEAVACVGTAGAGQGYQEENHAHLPRSDARSFLHRMREDHGLTEVPFYVALAFVEQAFESGGRRAPGWGHLIENLDTATRLTAQVLDPLAEATTELDVAALHNVGPLVRRGRDVVYLPEESETQAVMQEAVMSSVSAETGELEGASDRLKVVFDAAVDRLIGDPTTRATWSLALDVVTWLSAYRKEVDMVAPARATALALRAGHAGRDMPFFRESLEHAFFSLLQTSLQKGGEAGFEHGPAL